MGDEMLHWMLCSTCTNTKTLENHDLWSKVHELKKHSDKVNKVNDTRCRGVCGCRGCQSAGQVVNATFKKLNIKENSLYVANIYSGDCVWGSPICRIWLCSLNLHRPHIEDETNLNPRSVLIISLMRKLWQWENSGLVWTGYIQTAEFYLNLFFIRGEVFGRAINVPFYVTLIHSFTDAGQPAWRSASLSNIQQDPPHCPPFSSKSSVPEECTSWDFIPSSSHSAPGSSCECDDRSEWPQRTPLDPPPRRRRCCCHPHNANKQERDPFLPTVTQTWNPTPPLPPRSEGNPPLHRRHSTSCPTDSCEERKKDGLWKGWLYLYDS